MPYYYKREIPDLNGTGERQYRYELRSEGTSDLRQLAERVVRYYRSLTVGEVIGIVARVVEEMAHEMADGRSVTVDGLGSFAPSLGVEHRRQHYNEEDALKHETNARSVRVRGVNFRASRDIINRVDELCRGHLHREVGGPVTLRQSSFSRDERLRLTLQYIRAHGFLRLSEYAQLVGVSRTVASQQLADFTHDRSTPITSEGRGPSKVWVEVKP